MNFTIFPAGMTPNATQSILLAFMLAAPSLQAQYPEVWSWVQREGGVRSNAEILAYFHEHRASFDSAWSPRYAQSSAAYGAYRIAEAAYAQGDAEFERLLARADDLADGIARGGDIVISGVVNAHIGLLSALCEDGDFESAAALVDRARARLAGLPKELAGANGVDGGASLLAGYLGDFATVEELKTGQLAETERQDAQMRRMIGGRMKVASTSTFVLPILAYAQAGGGKDGAAKETLLRFDRQFAEDRVAWESMHELSPPGPGREAGVASQHHIEAMSLLFISSTWIELGDGNRALAVLDETASLLNRATPVFERLAELPDDNGGGSPGANARAYLAALPGLLREIESRRSRCLLLLGRHEEAAVVFRRRIAERAGDVAPHPETVSARRDLGWALLMGGDVAGAKAAAAQHAEAQLEMTSRLLGFASEQQRLAYLQHADPFSLLANLGEKDALADAMLRLKGVVLDSLIEERRMASRAGEGESRLILERLIATRKRLADAYLSGDREAGAIRNEVEALQRALTGETVAGGASAALQTTLDSVLSKLSPNEAILEFAKFRRLDEPGQWVPHYGAVLLRKGREPVWVDLGGSEAIDASISAMVARMSSSDPLANGQELESLLKHLHDRILSPLEVELEGADRIIVSPDGELGRLSFPIMIAPDGKFACERRAFAYVSTARDLLREARPPDGAMSLAIVADPDFDRTGDGEAGGRRLRAAYLAFDREALPQLAPLPGTRRETEILEAFGRSKQWQIVPMTGAEANEGNLREAARSANILHLATHGMVLAPAAPIRAAQRGTGETGPGMPPSFAPGVPAAAPYSSIVDDPLQRSVLALAGANSTFAQWAKGIVPPTEGDGVLNAHEVAAMDLEATHLAVLSACETASGMVLGGEGVVGMRRGFFLAGVDHLVMTFWPIADAETVEIMAAFYRRLGMGEHPATALVEVQREALVKWREEKGVAAAVFLAGPFALSASGELPAP